jgi:hypothetical protein
MTTVRVYLILMLVYAFLVLFILSKPISYSNPSMVIAYIGVGAFALINLFYIAYIYLREHILLSKRKRLR